MLELFHESYWTALKIALLHELENLALPLPLKSLTNWSRIKLRSQFQLHLKVGMLTETEAKAYPRVSSCWRGREEEERRGEKTSLKDQSSSTEVKPNRLRAGKARRMGNGLQNLGRCRCFFCMLLRTYASYCLTGQFSESCRRETVGHNSSKDSLEASSWFGSLR